MKIKFKRTELASSIAPLMATAVNRSTVPAVEGILIEAREPDTCIFTTYDLEKGIRTRVEAQVEEEGFNVVNAQKFFQTLQVLDGDEIEMIIDEKLGVIITDGKSKFRMNALRGEDFPAVPSLKSQMGFFIEQATLLRMFRKISYAMGTVDQRQVLNGCFVQVEDEEILMVACDSFKLAKCSRSMPIKAGNPEDRYIRYAFILPVKTVNELCRMLSDDEDSITRIYIMRKHIVFEIGEYVFFSRLIEGEYIDYDRIIQTNHPTTAILDREEMLGALERASLITEEKIAGSMRSHVKLEFETGALKISAVSTNGSSYDEIVTEHKGDNVLIAFNNRYLMDTIRATSTEKIKISMTSALASINVEPVDEDENVEEIFMLLPVRMREQ